jgi:hypothetical protein
LTALRASLFLGSLTCKALRCATPTHRSFSAPLFIPKKVYNCIPARLRTYIEKTCEKSEFGKKIRESVIASFSSTMQL